jgi:hypothetical protein
VARSPLIPVSAFELDFLQSELQRQSAEVREIWSSHARAALRWRPHERKWSIAGHVGHLCIVNGGYVVPLRRCVSEARERGLLSDGPYRHPWIGSWFARSMEPPPTRRRRTLKAMVPDPEPDVDDVLSEFQRLQGEVARIMSDARGVDLGRARFASPFLPILRLSLGTGLSALLAHNRRHLWLIREVMGSTGFAVAAGDA